MHWCSHSYPGNGSVSHGPISIMGLSYNYIIYIYIYMLTPPPDTYFLLLIPSFLRNYICAGSKLFARTMWVTCLRERGFKRMKLWRLCTKCCVTSSHLGKLQQVLCTNHGHMLEGGWAQKDEADSKGWSYEGFAQSAALQVLTWANYSKYFARITVTCLREGGLKRMKLWRLCTKCCVTSSHLGKLQPVLCTNHVVHVLDTLGRVDSKGWSCWGITLYWGKEWHLPTKPATEDPRSKIPRKFFLDAGWKSWMHPRSKIQDFQKTFLGNLGNLGINPRSKILGASKILQVHPRKVVWKSWILDLGCIQDFQGM